MIQRCCRYITRESCPSVIGWRPSSVRPIFTTSWKATLYRAACCAIVCLEVLTTFITRDVHASRGRCRCLGFIDIVVNCMVFSFTYFFTCNLVENGLQSPHSHSYLTVYQDPVCQMTRELIVVSFPSRISSQTCAQPRFSAARTPKASLV
jgi:hypothetical protein